MRRALPSFNKGRSALIRGINTREHANGGDGPPHGGRRALGRCASGTEGGVPSAPGVIAPQSALVSSVGGGDGRLASFIVRAAGSSIVRAAGSPLCGAVGTAAAACLWAAAVQRDARRSNHELLLGGLARLLLTAVRAGGDALLRK